MKAETQNDSIFNKIYNTFIEANEEKIENFKILLLNKKDNNILDLGIRVSAYDGAFLMQARSDYKHRELEDKSVSSFVASEGIMGTEETEKKVHRYFKSSFRPNQQQYHKQIKQLNIDTELEYATYKYDEDGIEQETSSSDTFKEHFLPEYRPKRKAFTTKLLRQLNLGKEKVKNIQISAFNSIIKLSNNKLRGDLVMLRAEYIRFLEDFIEYSFPLLLTDLGLEQHVKMLAELRQKSGVVRFNTVCNRCGKPLLKTGFLRFCSKTENRKCYEARRKENKMLPWPKGILINKNLCVVCGKYSSLNNIHKVKNLVERQFCSKKCYEAFRKRERRKLNKKTANLIS